MLLSQAMNENEAALRERMKAMLAGCTAAQQDLFRRMYNPHGFHAHPVDGVPRGKLDWAFLQIERTLAKAEGRTA